LNLVEDYERHKLDDNSNFAYFYAVWYDSLTRDTIDSENYNIGKVISERLFD